MSDNGSPVVKPVAAQVHEVVIRWIPQTGEVQFAVSTPDIVAQLGLLEAAKMALLEQKIQASLGRTPSVIVPGRFAS